MVGTQSITEIIKKRSSVRTYSEKEVEKEKIQKITESIQTNTAGPFGNTIKFELLDLGGMDEREMKNLGTYGIIRGAKLFVAGVIRDADRAMEDFGYCMEKVILDITGLGLGTCWLAGTFRRNNFIKKMRLARDELLPAITPVGYGLERRSFIDNTFRFFAGSKNRKTWDELFFLNDLTVPLSRQSAGAYFGAIESVRLAPSGSNKQPWRIIKEKGSDIFHFYLKRTRGYAARLGKIKVQNIDMGIAMCHFELAVSESGKTGSWKTREPQIESGDMEYIISWLGS